MTCSSFRSSLFHLSKHLLWYFKYFCIKQQDFQWFIIAVIILQSLKISELLLKCHWQASLHSERNVVTEQIYLYMVLCFHWFILYIEDEYCAVIGPLQSWDQNHEMLLVGFPTRIMKVRQAVGPAPCCQWWWWWPTQWERITFGYKCV